MRRSALLLVILSVAAAAQDSAEVLARILAEKGTITRSELTQVEAAASADRVAVLASLLQAKGILSAGDMAKLSPSGSSPQVVVENLQPPSAGPQIQTEAPPVTAVSKFPISVYGTILMNAFYNTAATNISDIPLFTAKQGADSLGNDKNFGMTARQSRFGLRYRGTDVAGGRFTGQLEFDLLGGKAPFPNSVNMDLIRVRLALGRIDWSNFSFIAGQDWSVFAPLNPTSLAEFAIASLSSSGNPWIRMPQIRTEFRGGQSGGFRYLAQLAAVDPNMGDYNTTVFSGTRPPGAGERGRSPGVEARLALTASEDDRDFTLGLSGHWAHGKNSGVVDSKTLQLPFDSWGTAIDYSLPFTRLFNLTGELYTGRALGIFSIDTGEAVGAPGGPGALGVHSYGGWTQAQLNFTPKWQINLVYGIDSPRARDLPVGNRTRNQSYMGNVMYKYSAHFTVAGEYRRLLTDFRNQPFANERGDHANLAFGYTF